MTHTTRALDTMQTMTFTDMRAMSAAVAQRFILLCGDVLGFRERAILEHREVLASSSADMPGCVVFTVPGAQCVIRRHDGAIVT